MTISIKQLSAEIGVSQNQIRKVKEDKLSRGEYVHKKGVLFFSEDGANKIRLHFIAPLTVPKVHSAWVTHQARNSRWVFCSIEGVGDKVLVAIPKKLSGKLTGKKIEVEAIEDVSGVTYRHAIFSS